MLLLLDHEEPPTASAEASAETPAVPAAEDPAEK